MKKTIITLLALAGAAMAETLTLLPDLSAGATRHNLSVGGNLGNGGLTADSLATVLTSTDGAELLTTGWHWGITSGNTGFTDDLTIADNNAGFTFYGRANYQGEYMLASVKVSELLAGNTDEYVNSITIDFNVTESNGLTFSAWSWDGTTATKITGSGVGVGDYNLTKDVALTSDDTLLFVYSSNAGGKTNTITGLTSSYTTAPVPEPATATLSLLALAGLAARRRRK